MFNKPKEDYNESWEKNSKPVEQNNENNSRYKTRI